MLAKRCSDLQLCLHQIQMIQEILLDIVLVLWVTFWLKNWCGNSEAVLSDRL